jgi:hypothetical protein
MSDSFGRASLWGSIGLFLLMAGTGLSQKAPKRDHLTEKEVDLVREYQELDLRVEVFIRAAGRRVLLLIDPSAKQKKKEEEIWGPLPTGNRLELLQDYQRILEELEEKLDDALNIDPRQPLLKKALNKAKDGVERHLIDLRRFGASLSDASERKALTLAIEEAERIAGASF